MEERKKHPRNILDDLEKQRNPQLMTEEELARFDKALDDAMRASFEQEFGPDG